jgi:hypothetical protein
VRRIAPEKKPVNRENPLEMRRREATSRMRAETRVVTSKPEPGVASGRNLKKEAERKAVKHNKSVC